MRFFSFILVVISLSFCGTTNHQLQNSADENKLTIRTGAEQTEKYIPLLQVK
jgi:hypothetical protein